MLFRWRIKKEGLLVQTFKKFNAKQINKHLLVQPEIMDDSDDFV